MLHILIYLYIRPFLFSFTRFLLNVFYCLICGVHGSHQFHLHTTLNQNMRKDYPTKAADFKTHNYQLRFPIRLQLPHNDQLHHHTHRYSSLLTKKYTFFLFHQRFVVLRRRIQVVARDVATEIFFHPDTYSSKSFIIMGLACMGMVASSRLSRSIPMFRMNLEDIMSHLYYITYLGALPGDWYKWRLEEKKIQNL